MDKENLVDSPIEIWTDGACSGNPGPGGAAAIIHFSNGNIKELSYHEDNSTNQRMEIRAVIIALLEVIATPHKEKNIKIYSDSAYVCNCINQKWYEKWFMNGWVNSKKEPVANRELWESLFKYLDILKEKHSISFIKVKGHSGNFMNEKVDKLAVLASKGEINDKCYNTLL